MANCRKDQQGDRIEQEDGAHGDADLFLVRPGDRRDGGDRASAADRGARRNQERRLCRHLKQAAKQQAKQHGAGDADRGVEEAGAAGVHHLLQIHAESKSHDRGLQKQLGQRMALHAERMLHGEAECDSTGQRNGRGDDAAGRKKKTYEKDGPAVHRTYFSSFLRGKGPSRNMMGNKQSFADDFRLFFAYTEAVTRTLETVGPGALRCELSHRNSARAAGLAAEMSYGPVPSIVYGENEAGEHGNFLAASYKRILQQPDWKARLAKVYTGSRFLPRKADRTRRELECANSSDALLMNIFCYPGILCRAAVCSLLGIEPGIHPTFGFRPGIPLKNGAEDRSEMDLKLGKLLVEAKLTEGDFQTARLRPGASLSRSGSSLRRGSAAHEE